jgi:hypothetical protein
LLINSVFRLGLNTGAFFLREDLVELALSLEAHFLEVVNEVSLLDSAHFDLT